MKYNVLKSYAGDKVVEPTAESRTKDALKGAALQLGLGLLLRKGVGELIKKNPQAFEKGLKSFLVKPYRSPVFGPQIIGDAIFGTALGVVNQDIRNAIIRANKNPDEMESLSKALMHHGEVTKLTGRHMLKTSSIVGAGVRGLSGAGKLLYRGGTAAAYGMLPMGPGRLGRVGRRVAGRTTAFPVSHRIFGTAVKGGAALGGIKAFQKIREAGRPVNRSYTAFLRNNILAGKIGQKELPLEDMMAVRKLGMK